MNNNSWIVTGTILSVLILGGLGYNMYSNNKESILNKKSYEEDYINEMDERFGGRKSKHHKYRKNVSKKRRK